MATSSPRLTRAMRWTVYFAAVCVTAAGLVALFLVLAGAFEPKVHPQRAAGTRAPLSRGQVGELPVGEVRLVRRSRRETAVGSVRPVHEAEVASKLLARVEEVNVKAGQAVAEGDLLVKLDDAELVARLKQAESAVAAAQSRYVRARSDYARAEQVIGTRALSQAEFDEIVAEMKMAEADLRRAQQAVDEAQVRLDYAAIRSPLTGVVVDKRVEPGDTVTPGQVLLSLYDPSRMQLVATVRESLAERLRVGDEIAARLDAVGYECQATVSEIVPEAESASRSFTVKVTGPCPPGVYSGMFGRIFVPLSDEEVLAVPPRAVFRVGQLSMVEVIQGDRVERRIVQLGRQLAEGYEVLAGLSEGERVIIRSPSAATEVQQ